jgi:hypothetical protein
MMSREAEQHAATLRNQKDRRIISKPITIINIATTLLICIDIMLQRFDTCEWTSNAKRKKKERIIKRTLRRIAAGVPLVAYYFIIARPTTYFNRYNHK